MSTCRRCVWRSHIRENDFSGPWCECNYPSNKLPVAMWGRIPIAADREHECPMFESGLGKKSVIEEVEHE